MFVIKHIDIVLENCDVIKIDGKHIGYFLMDDIRKNAGVIGCNSFGVRETAEETLLEISQDANVKYNPLGIKSEENFVFDRLMKYDDITAIDIYTDTDTLRYLVKWVGDSDYANDAQSSAIGKNGCLYVVVSENTDAKELCNVCEKAHPTAARFNAWLRSEWGDDAENIRKKLSKEPADNTVCRTCSLRDKCDYKEGAKDECLNRTGNVSVEDAMEIGNMLFGNSRGLFYVDRAWEDKFYEIFSAAGLDSYGYAPESVATERGGFENDMFHIEPYYWGDNEDLEDEPNFWYKPDGLEIQWYKYAFRDSYCNKKISYLEFCEIVDKCIESLEKKED